MPLPSSRLGLAASTLGDGACLVKGYSEEVTGVLGACSGSFQLCRHLQNALARAARLLPTVAMLPEHCAAGKGALSDLQASKSPSLLSSRRVQPSHSKPLQCNAALLLLNACASQHKIAARFVMEGWQQ